ncbi:EI24 domain-containing protein [Qipengyuania sp.]|uniref:EI24 domain-containing protein n=1 Tax=Qipengyuania sp. TaxID=2004515 RepID=UPI003AF98378
MLSLPRALALALGQLGDPAIVRILGKTAVLTLAIFAAGGVGFYVALDAMFGDRALAGLGALAAALVTLVAGWFLFRVVSLFVLQFFAEDVVRAVEKRHYPQAAATARPIGFGEELRGALRSLARTLVANILALPVAGLLLLSGFGPALVFLFVNAWLIGRELQDLVWLPHRADAAELAPISGGTRLLLGGAVVALLAIPFLNLLAPIVGAACATHLVHRAREKELHA